jgi:hypothetical protein
VTRQRGGEVIGPNDEDDGREHVDGGPAYSVLPPAPEPAYAAVATAGDPIALAASQARHRSSVGRCRTHDPPTCPACGSASTTADNAPDAVRRLVGLARELLGGGSDEQRRNVDGRPPTVDESRLERIARLRDELYATANRVARFGLEEHPVVDLVRITGPTATSAALGPAQLLFQLDMSARRLIALPEPLSSHDWTRTGGMGERVVTLGDLVDRVLHGASHDVLDLLRPAPVLAQQGIAAIPHRRTRPDPRETQSPTHSPGSDTHRHVAAS